MFPIGRELNRDDACCNCILQILETLNMHSILTVVTLLPTIPFDTKTLFLWYHRLRGNKSEATILPQHTAKSGLVYPVMTAEGGYASNLPKHFNSWHPNQFKK